MGSLNTARTLKAKYTIDFTQVIKASDMSYIEILDFELGHHLLSAKLTDTTKGRYYFRYGMLIVYEYDVADEDTQSLVDLRCMKTDKEGVLQEELGYAKYWHTMLTVSLPAYFKMHLPNKKYRVKFAYTRFPFRDEHIEIVNQDCSVQDGFNSIPMCPKSANFLLVVENQELVGIQVSYRRLDKRTFGEIKYDILPVTQESIHNGAFNVMKKDLFLKIPGSFWRLRDFDSMIILGINSKYKLDDIKPSGKIGSKRPNQDKRKYIYDFTKAQINSDDENEEEYNTMINQINNT